MAEQTNIYWKDAEKLSLATFKPEGLDENLVKAGWAARNGLNKTLVEIFKQNDEVIPELTTQEVKKPKDFARLSTDEEYRNKNMYPARAKVTVELATYTKDYTDKNGVQHAKGDPIMKRDGTQALNIKAEWLIDTDALTLNLNEDGGINNISARTGIAKGQSPTFVKKEDLAASDLSDDLKVLAAAIVDGGYIVERGASKGNYTPKYENEALNTVFFEAKKYFKENCETVTRKNKDGEEFESPKSYVTDISDEYGPKIKLANVDERDTIVEIGLATYGKDDAKGETLYVMGTHFNGEGNPAERLFVNSLEDVKELFKTPEIQKITCDFLENNNLVGSLYATMRNMNTEFADAGIRDNTYAIFSSSVYEKNQHTYENLTIVDDGMAVARISRDANYKNPIFTVEAIDPNHEEGTKAKTTLLNDKNIDKLIPNPDIADQLKSFVAENKVKTLEDMGKDR